MSSTPSPRRSFKRRPTSTAMNAIGAERRPEDWDDYQEEQETERLPRRRRRQFFNRRSAAVGALITCAIGFYAGVRVEKGQLSNSSSSRLSALTGGTAATRGGSSRAGLAALFGSGRGSGSAGAAAGAAGGAAGALGAGGAAGGANASFGTVASVAGKTIYVTEASGNTVKVKLSSATKLSKTQSVKRSAIHPGDTVIVSGVPGSGGSLTAATVTDSGNRGGATGASGSTTGSGSGSGSSGSGSAVGSLFSSGG
jgi:hypothetical protein